MALFTYLDAGGTKDLPSLSAAGYIAREEQWQAFGRDWAGVLARFGVTELHMKNFAHFRKDFVTWQGDEPRRAAFLAALTDIIKTHTLKHVAVILHTSVYHQLNAAATVRERLGTPYALTMLSALLLAKDWAETCAPGEPMSFFIEYGDHDQGDLLNLLWALEFPHRVRPVRKTVVNSSGTAHVMPFQAADFLAYEYQKAIRTMRDRGVQAVKARKSAFYLIPIGEDRYSRVIDVHSLGELCLKLGVKRRSI